jgi:hypothetical protein
MNAESKLVIDFCLLKLYFLLNELSFGFCPPCRVQRKQTKKSKTEVVFTVSTIGTNVTN